MSATRNMFYKQRVTAMRELLAKSELDAVIISHDDEYLSYELNEDRERIRFMSGFSGSAGYIVIARTCDSKALATGIKGTASDRSSFTIHIPAAVFTDGRYTVQVKEQIDPDCYECFDLAKVRPVNWLTAVLPKKARVGLDLNCVSYDEYLSILEELEARDIELVATAENLADILWDPKPEHKYGSVSIFPDEYNGCPSPQKRHDLAATLREHDYDATVICDPESICWLLNIRGEDRSCLPIVNCRLVAYSNEALELYIDDNYHIDNQQDELTAHFGHIDIFPEQRFDEALSRLSNSSASVYVDPETTNAHILKELYEGGATVTEGLGLLLLPKARKNSREISGEIKAHIKDGIAMCRFLSWLDSKTSVGLLQEEAQQGSQDETLTEKDLADHAEAFRQVEENYLMPSFDTISALGPNAAMCHYNYATAASPRSLGQDPLYLIDSGGHYLEGTTDITRTALVGPGVTAEMRRMYTLVLKGHISFATLIFPPGTSGMQLDAIARRPLWDFGFDYAHGTGHGVGHVLSVHEGPQNVSMRRSAVPLESGMVISDEPGYYKEGEYGIRLENLLTIINCRQPGLEHMLCFSPLTLVPFDTRLIIKELLTPKEREWLNSYHKDVRELIVKAAPTLTDTEVSWLTKATEAL